MREVRSVLLAVLILAPVARTAVAEERLVLEPYPGPPAWTLVTDKRAGQQFLREYIPSGQRVEAYHDILTAQSFPQQRAVDPSVFLRGVFQGVAGRCGNIRVNGPTPRQEGGYRVAYAQIACNRETGKDTGAYMFFKAIQGEEALYVVQRELRTAPSETAGVQEFAKDKMAEAMAQLKAEQVADRYLVDSVYLCGARSTDRRCLAK